MRRSLQALFFFYFFFITYTYSQKKIDGYVFSPGPLFSNSGVSIELGFKIPKSTCDSTSRKARFALFVNNSGNLKNVRRYLNWKIDYVNCNNDVVEKTVSIEISNLNDMLNTSLDWDFEAKQIERDFYNVKNEDSPDYTKDKVKAKAVSTPPDSIAGNTEIIIGETVTLTVVGGSLTRDAKWVWYSGSCPGGIKEGEGPTLVKGNINKSMVFYVRAEGQINTTVCVSKQVNVDNNSRPADAIQGKSVVCSKSGDKALLYVLGGKKGLNAKWIWYQGSCNGNKIGEGDSIYVLPSQTSTYYVRAEGPTISPTTCVSHTIEVVDPSIQPVSIVVGQPNTCVNQPVTLSVSGGKLSKMAEWVWRSIGESNIAYRNEGSGESLVVYPDEPTSYFVSAQDVICPSTDEISIKVNVKSLSSDPYSIDVNKVKRNKYTLSVIGGTLGSKAKWVWYKGDCENGKRIASGEAAITYKVKKGDNTVFVRAEGDCNMTNCVSTEIVQTARTNRSGKAKRKNFWFINGGVVTNDVSNVNNFIATLGCRWAYVSYKFHSKAQSNYSYNDAGLVEGVPSGNTYEFTGRKFYNRSSVTGGFLVGGGVLRVYLGGGFGNYQQYREINIIDASSNTVQSTHKAKRQYGLDTGAEAEGGLFLRMGSVTLMAGSSTVFIKSLNSPFTDFHLSLGLKF